MNHDVDIAAELRALAAYAYVGSYVREHLLRAAGEIERLRRIEMPHRVREALDDEIVRIANFVYSEPDRLSPDAAEEAVSVKSRNLPINFKVSPALEVLARGNELMDDIRDAESEAVARRALADLDEPFDD